MVADLLFPSAAATAANFTNGRITRQQTLAGIPVPPYFRVPTRRNYRSDTPTLQGFIGFALVKSTVAIKSIHITRNLIQQIVHLFVAVQTPAWNLMFHSTRDANTCQLSR